MSSPEPSHGQPRTPTPIVHSGEAQMDPTSALLLHPGELWSNNQLRKFTLRVSGLRLGAPIHLHRSSGPGRTSMPYILMDDQGDRKDSGRRRI